MILLQLSAAQGPAECCLAVAHALGLLLAEAGERGLKTDHVEQEDEPEKGTMSSVLLSIDGAGAAQFAEGWAGSHLWICASSLSALRFQRSLFTRLNGLCGLEVGQALAIICEGDEEPFGFDLFDAPE